MNIAHATVRPSCEYLPTIIETKPLISRLAIQLAFFRDELKRGWPNFKENPVASTKVPAVKGGRPVSVSMQLEYNFNLY